MPCSPLKVNRRFGGTCLLLLQDRRISQTRNLYAFKLVSYLGYSSILKTEATCSSETLVDFYRTIWRYISEDSTNRVIFFVMKYHDVESDSKLILIL
jgi:hypothetical protein